MSRRLRALLLLLTLAVGGACYRSTRTPVAPEQLPETIAGWQKNSRLVLSNGREIDAERAPELLGDSLILVHRCCRDRGPRRWTDTIPVSEVTHVAVRRLSPGRTVAAVILIPVGVLVGVALLSSCPIIYAYDGAQYVAVAEPLGGAISAGLGRTDLSRLEHLVLADGEYRIIIANELDETQYLDAFSLLAVEHPQGTSVIADRQGNLFAAGALTEPLSARSTSGDVLPQLRAHDGAWWPDDAVRFRPGHTRDTLTLTFPRPEHDRARLILHARTSPLAAKVLKSMLELWGGEVDRWYAMLDHSAAVRASNEEWVLREELWALKVWVRERDGWRAQEIAMGGGPIVSELQSIPLDLSRVEGATVELQLHPPHGYWDIEYAALDAAPSDPLPVTPLAMTSAQSLDGQDTRALLAAADGEFLVMPIVGQRIELTFAATPPPAGVQRTVFSSTTGYYRVHTDRSGARQAAVLDSLWLQPGYPVLFAERAQRARERRAAR
jgi:hypothetical protein